MSVHRVTHPWILAQTGPHTSSFLQAKGRQNRKIYQRQLSYSMRSEVCGPPSREAPGNYLRAAKVVWPGFLLQPGSRGKHSWAEPQTLWALLPQRHLLRLPCCFSEPLLASYISIHTLFLNKWHLLESHQLSFWNSVGIWESSVSEKLTYNVSPFKGCWYFTGWLSPIMKNLWLAKS